MSGTIKRTGIANVNQVKSKNPKIRWIAEPDDSEKRFTKKELISFAKFCNNNTSDELLEEKFNQFF